MFFFSCLSVVRISDMLADSCFRIYMVNHGCLAFPEKVAVCVYFFLCVEPWELDLLANSFPLFLWCTINSLLKLHASNAFLFKKMRETVI